MKKLAFLLATAIAALAGVNTASAQTVSWSGSWTVTNSTTEQLAAIANTYPGGTLSNLGSPLSAGSSAFPNLLRQTSGTVWASSFSYDGSIGLGGCIFTTLGIYNRRTARYSYTFSATPTITGQTRTCSHTGSWNSVTGAFNATAIVGP
jgi:hypothetical protein